MSVHHRGAAAILQGGAIAFVEKPFHVDEIVSVIDAALQLKHEERSHRRRVGWTGVCDRRKEALSGSVRRELG